MAKIPDNKSSQPQNSEPFQDRRAFLRTSARLAATGIAARAAGLIPPAVSASHPQPRSETPEPLGAPKKRAEASLKIRRDTAVRNWKEPLPNHVDNRDEDTHPTRIGNFSKGLPHNEMGIVAAPAYDTLLKAIRSGDSDPFERIPLGGTVRLVNPQAGLTFDLEGADSHRLEMPPAPKFASAERAAEAVECYWMSLLRDVAFADYAKNEAALAACAELSNLSDFRAPKKAGKVTPESLFRGFTTGDLLGPYISQFLLHPLNYGALPLKQAIRTYLALSDRGEDYLTTSDSWLAAQNGQGPFEMNRFDPIPRHIRNGRDLSAYVHVDHAYQAFFNATLFFGHNRLPLNPGNPYKSSKTQSGFATFGLPHIQGMLGIVAGCALRAVWYQKWFVHRTLRPEEFGGRVLFALAAHESSPIHADILRSKAVERVYAANKSYFLPQAFPEGCPQHPSYAQGHAAVAGACATLLKAFFDGNRPIEQFSRIVQPSGDGLELRPYPGADATDLTVGSELDKLASNIAIGRNHAGIHWRSDHVAGLLLGEAATVAVLRDQRRLCSEYARRKRTTPARRPDSCQ